MVGDESDIREEVAFHLDMRTRDNERDGLERSEARQAAEARFGSVERVVGECLRVKNGGRIMLQRINLAMVAVLLVAVAVLGWRLASDSAERADEMKELRGEISKLVDRRGKQLLMEQYPELPKVYLMGRIKNKGAVPIMGKHPMTLMKAIASAGGFDQYARTGAVQILRKGPEEGEKQTTTVDFDAIIDGKADDVVLEPNDVVFVPEAVF